MARSSPGLVRLNNFGRFVAQELCHTCHENPEGFVERPPADNSTGELSHRWTICPVAARFLSLSRGQLTFAKTPESLNKLAGVPPREKVQNADTGERSLLSGKRN